MLIKHFKKKGIIILNTLSKTKIVPEQIINYDVFFKKEKNQN